MIRLRWASQLALVVDPARQYRRLKRRGFDSWVGKISGSRKWQPTAVSSSGKSHGQRSPWGHKSWTRLSTHTLTGLDEVSGAGPHPPQGGEEEEPFLSAI